GGAPVGEYGRKVRTLVGNFQLVALQPWLLRRGRNRLFWQLVSHKLLRLAVPWALLAFLLASLVLAAATPASWPRALLALQAVLYSAAAIGWRLERSGRRVRPPPGACALGGPDPAAAGAAGALPGARRPAGLEAVALRGVSTPFSSACP